jgi:hypothetical protein
VNTASRLESQGARPVGLTSAKARSARGNQSTAKWTKSHIPPRILADLYERLAPVGMRERGID